MPGFLFVEGFEGDMYMQDWAFLIEHPPSGKKLLFDLGLKRRLAAYSEETKRLFETWPGEADNSVKDALSNAGISLEAIETIIYSHLHLCVEAPRTESWACAS